MLEKEILDTYFFQLILKHSLAAYKVQQAKSQNKTTNLAPLNKGLYSVSYLFTRLKIGSEKMQNNILSAVQNEIKDWYKIYPFSKNSHKKKKELEHFLAVQCITYYGNSRHLHKWKFVTEIYKRILKSFDKGIFNKNLEKDSFDLSDKLFGKHNFGSIYLLAITNGYFELIKNNLKNDVLYKQAEIARIFGLSKQSLFKHIIRYEKKQKRIRNRAGSIKGNNVKEGASKNYVNSYQN